MPAAYVSPTGRRWGWHCPRCSALFVSSAEPVYGELFRCPCCGTLAFVEPESARTVLELERVAKPASSRIGTESFRSADRRAR